MIKLNRVLFVKGNNSAEFEKDKLDVGPQQWLTEGVLKNVLDFCFMNYMFVPVLMIYVYEGLEEIF